jgi:hypothetical protein
VSVPLGIALYLAVLDLIGIEHSADMPGRRYADGGEQIVRQAAVTAHRYRLPQVGQRPPGDHMRVDLAKPVPGLCLDRGSAPTGPPESQSDRTTAARAALPAAAPLRRLRVMVAAGSSAMCSPECA